MDMIVSPARLRKTNQSKIKLEQGENILSEIANDVARIVEQAFKQMVSRLELVGTETKGSSWVEKLMHQPAALTPK
jgi:hypothetical protein